MIELENQYVRARRDVRAEARWYARFRYNQAKAIAWLWYCKILEYKQLRHDVRNGVI